MNRLLCLLLVVFVALACATPAPSPTPTPPPTPSPTATLARTPTPIQPWVEEEIRFALGDNELFGILTLPTTQGPHPGVVIITGAVDTETRVHAGVSEPYHIETARKMATAGLAVLRYDPPGVGQSSGQAGFEPLNLRAEEAIAALRAVQSRADIRSGRVGLWGISQGAWVIAMAAAKYANEVAFIVPVSGSGVSVAEQQVFSVEAQTRSGHYPEEDVTKASMFARLLVDWQLVEPMYRQTNESDALALGEGPWSDFTKLVYEPGPLSAAEGLQRGIDIFKSIQDEPWAKYLFLRELYIPQLESIPPDQVEAMKAYAGPNLLNDPREYMNQVRCPVLAIFGAKDLLQPTGRSAALYEQYLTEAGNQDVQIVVLPDAGHSIGIWTEGYWDALGPWLERMAER